MASLQTAILERLAAGESPEEILLSLRSDGERELLRRCAVVRTFDRAVFDRVLAGATPQADVPSFDEFVQSPEVEAVPRTSEVYRLRRERFAGGDQPAQPGDVLLVRVGDEECGLGDR